MNALRRLGVVLWLALALVAGQQAAAAHALTHAGDGTWHKQDSKPGKACGECSVAAQLSAGAPPFIPSLVVARCGHEPVFGAFHAELPAPAVPYLSRGPPLLS